MIFLGILEWQQGIGTFMMILFAQVSTFDIRVVQWKHEELPLRTNWDIINLAIY